MDRGIITISEAGMVTIPTVPVWMTQQEITDLLGVFASQSYSCYPQEQGTG